MSERPFVLRIAALAMGLALVAGTSSALTYEEERMVQRAKEAADLFEIQRINETAQELKGIVDAGLSTRDARRVRAKISIGVLADMRTREELRAYVDQIMGLAQKGDDEVLKDPRFFEELSERVVSNDREVRRAAHDDLFVLGEAATPHLVKVLGQVEGGENQMRVVLALGELGSQAVLPLAEVLQSENYVLRHNAIYLLGESRDTRALPELIRLYRTMQEPNLRNEVGASIQKISRARPEDLPDPQTAYANEAVRALSGARQYATSPSKDKATLWRWEGATQELVGNEVPREIYRELIARRFLERGLTLGYTPQLAELLPPLYLRLAVKLSAGSAPELAAEASTMLHLAGVARIARALDGALVAKSKEEALIALDVLYDLGVSGNLLGGGGWEDEASDAAWMKAFLHKDPEMSFRAAKAAVALSRPVQRARGWEIVPALVAQLRLALGVGRVLVVSSDSNLANEAAAMLRELPAAAETVNSADEGLFKLDSSTAYSAIILDEKDAGLLSGLEERGLLAKIPVIYLTTQEKAPYAPKGVTVVTQPLVSATLVRVARERSGGAKNDLPRAREILGVLLLAEERGYVPRGSLGGLVGDLSSKGDSDLRGELLPLIGRAGDMRDLAALFAFVEAKGRATAEKKLALAAIGDILQRFPSPSEDMLASLLALVEGKDAELAQAAAAALAVTPFPANRFAETFLKIVEEGS
ncbi:MAG: HEAT repeat domain-containing protein [Planctomycetota bacterium]